ncbi:hypothetical protein AB0L80_02490 [Streptomyces sp. NPDC052069]|uniref:hypothetical protein n=1 Tax=Streptomyces sp. NPDC052069 TaxID=3154650 RepID=UPI0034477E1A
MTTALAVPLAARRAADDLAAVREQWGDLLAAIARRPAAQWPPREARGFLDQLATDDAADDEQPAATVGRMPLILREHPAPLNLDALDAAIDVERALFDLADAVAEQVQRSVRYTATDQHGRHRYQPDPTDRDDPARWHYQTQGAPGSRAFGLHWAAVWLEGRALGEDPADLFTAVPPLLLDQLASTAARARRDVERALGRDGRTTTLDDPCPWCAGPLTGRTRAGGEPVVTCSSGFACGAPVDLDDRGRRSWGGAELVGLFVALEAARTAE